MRDDQEHDYTCAHPDFPSLEQKLACGKKANISRYTGLLVRLHHLEKIPEKIGTGSLLMLSGEPAPHGRPEVREAEHCTSRSMGKTVTSR